MLEKLLFISIEKEVAISDNSIKLMNEISKDEFNMFVPVTSMSKSEYEKLDLEVQPQYALASNGGILLKDGGIDEEWYNESIELARKCQAEFEITKKILKANKDTVSDAEFVDELYWKAKCDDPENIVTTLLGTLYHSDVKILDIENEVYVIPKALDKGECVERFISHLKEKEQYYIEATYGIGACFLDVNMLEKLNYVYVSKPLKSNNFTFISSPNYLFEVYEGDGDFLRWGLNMVFRGLESQS